MLVKKDFHPVHYELLKAEKETGRDFSNLGKGSTQKIYIFSNGYGASVINGSMSFGRDELAVLFFENPFKIKRSGTKRLKKKLLKQAGSYHLSYDTTITSDVKRYYDHKELQRDLNLISKL